MLMKISIQNTGLTISYDLYNNRLYYHITAD